MPKKLLILPLHLYTLNIICKVDKSLFNFFHSFWTNITPDLLFQEYVSEPYIFQPPFPSSLFFIVNSKYFASYM